MLSKHEWIEHLGLRPHPCEGGYYREVYASPHVVHPSAWAGEPRPCLDTIYYMLTDDSPIGYFHRNRADIVHFFHAGSPLRYWVVHASGHVAQHVLGPDPRAGHRLQLVVPGGAWKATELLEGELGLLGEAVGPAFDPRDRTMASRAALHAAFPHLEASLLRLAHEHPPLA